ncbi:Transcription factor tga4 [Stylosanthes scabra]|uniref:Transcription factor tga4 n=1 Tax=Stylosanthes scabra TaxID=79078 RepID=A0ABU6THZ3_9FABA|nr:Transcription factor tga4 [Stylosanthes scabra]
MNSPTSHFVPPRRMGVYDPIHQISMWEENFRNNVDLSASTLLIDDAEIKFDNQSEYASHGIPGTSKQYDQEANRLADKIQRRLAQNREAARKSRLRKKAYVQQLESCRVKLMQLEQEVDHAKQKGLHIGGTGLGSNSLDFAASVNSGITSFEMEYGHWLEERNRLTMALRNALNSHVSDIELGELVDGAMSHYFKLFGMKSAAAKADAFYVMSGMWKSSAERFFFWIGGFRPSEILKILVPRIETMTEQQRSDISNLGKSCQQAEDALSQGMDKLQQMVSESVAAGQLEEQTDTPHMSTAMERLAALVSFVNQADHLRQETLLQMSRILTKRQAARWLLALGEYFQSLQALSSFWANRPPKPA